MMNSIKYDEKLILRHISIFSHKNQVNRTTMHSKLEYTHTKKVQGKNIINKVEVETMINCRSGKMQTEKK